MRNGKRCLLSAALTLLFAAALAKSQTATDPCEAAPLDPSPYQVRASAPDPATDSKVELVITPPLKEAIAAACFESAATAPEVLKGSDQTRVRIAVPGRGSQAGHQKLPGGTYTVRLLLESVPPATGRRLLATTLRVPLVLKAIRPHPIGPAGDPFTLSLIGSGFDAVVPSNNVLTLDGEPRDVCWTDSECNARHSRLRGVSASPSELVIAGFDPAEERNAEFRVSVGRESAGPLRDEDAERRWAKALAISALLSLGVIGLVLLLMLTVRKETVRGEDYILRLLFLDKETNTYSLSKVQFYIWTVAAVFGYIYLAIAKNYFQGVFGLPAVPAGLPGIVGISAGTAVASQVVTAINGPKGAGQIKPSLSNLVTTGDVVAAERVQFLVWTLIGAAGFVIFTARLDPRTLRDLPDIPATLLAISGISAFGYLGGKLARDPGPVVHEIVMSSGPDPDESAAAGPFGLIEVRGRNLSQDALFRIDRVELSFNKLIGRKPRIVERDGETKQETMAKRLRLVVLLDDETAPLFVSGSEHLFAITNPDSQRAVFQVKVPESQKPA